MENCGPTLEQFTLWLPAEDRRGKPQPQHEEALRAKSASADLFALRKGFSPLSSAVDEILRYVRV
jgi:hypothetical protein